MIRVFACVLCLLLPWPAWADGLVSMAFHQARLVDVVRVAFDEIQGAPYTMSNDFITSNQLVTLSLKSIEKEKLISQVESMVRDAGFSVRQVDGIFEFGKARADELTDFVYRPNYRAVSYLVELVSSFFKSGAFSNQRQVKNVGESKPATSGAASRPADSGTSAYSLQDRNQTDVLVFRGSVADVVRLKSLLDQLDKPQAELIVKGVILEVSTDSKDQNALTLAASILGGKFGLAFGKRGASDYSAMVSLAGIEAVVSALSTDSRFKVLSSPTLRVRSGSTAKLTVGSETPILGALQFNQAGQSIQSVEYKPSGVILELTPQIKECVFRANVTGDFTKA